MLGTCRAAGFSETALSDRARDVVDGRAAATGLVVAIWMQFGASIGACPSRYSVGVSPTISLKVRLNVPRLENPTLKQMSVTF